MDKNALEMLDKEIEAAAVELQRAYYEPDRDPMDVMLLEKDRDSLLAAGELRLLTDDLAQQDHAWKIYSGALRNTITGGDQWPNLQLPTTPVIVQWDDPEFGPYYFHRVISDLLNATGSSYKKTSKSFSERFGYFLNDVKREPINEDALNNSRTAMLAAMQAEVDHADILESIEREWQDYDDRQRSGSDPSRWRDIDWWYDRRYRRVLDASERIVLARWGKYLFWIQEAYGGQETLYKILDKFRTARKIEVKIPRLGDQVAGKRKVYPYEISVDYPTWIEDARARQTPNVKFTIKKDSYQYDYSHTRIGGGVGVHFGFFGILVAGRRQTTQVDTLREGFELNFEADIQTFEMTPGEWYDSSAFELFREGPFFPGSPMDNLHRRKGLFGPNGYISFRPMRAIVAYKPKVRVKLWRNEYHYFRQVTQGGGGFFIGPFLIGGGGYYNEEVHVRWDDRNYTIDLFDAPETPVVLAFDSEEL